MPLRPASPRQAAPPAAGPRPPSVSSPRRRPWLHGGGRHVGDRRPLHVLRAEGVRRSGPRPAAKRLAQLGRGRARPSRPPRRSRRPAPRPRGRRGARGPRAPRGEVTLAIEAEERRHVVVAGRVEETRGPAQDRRRVADGAERVAHVVLAVAEGPLAVLPRLAPVDGGEADQEGAGGQQPRQRGRGGRRPTVLEDVVAAQVVVQARGDAVRLGDEQVALGRVEVAARGVGAQRPPGAAVLLPRGEAERQLEEGPERRPAERARRDRARPVEIAPGGREVVAGQRELDARRARRRSGTGPAGWPSRGARARERSGAGGACSARGSGERPRASLGVPLTKATSASLPARATGPAPPRRPHPAAARPRALGSCG